MIQVSNLSKYYGKKRILQEINFTAACGECVAIVGRNGCGKTTLMQILAGGLKPDCGEIRYFGQDPLKNFRYYRKYCGYVPQELPLLGELSVRDNLRLWGADRSEQYEWIVDTFDLGEIMKIPVQKLSGGMKRRLSIACALAKWPPILLMDEPATALDLYYKDWLCSWIREYRKMNGIVVMTTHDEKEIMESDKCLVMCEGHLREVTEGCRKMEQIRKLMGMQEEEFLKI
nr:ABC transporter ATP-binding protein [uncultured Faecalimonas sp.]